IYAYSQGALDFSGADNVVQIPFSRRVEDLVPDAALAYYRENRVVWESAAELARMLGRKTVMRDVLDMLDALDAKESSRPDVEKAEAEVLSWLEFDYAFAIGSFALEYGLEPAAFGKELKVDGALHLNLAHAAAGVPVAYELTREHQVALLTGANSGGKTTLLET